MWEHVCLHLIHESHWYERIPKYYVHALGVFQALTSSRCTHMMNMLGKREMVPKLLRDRSATLFTETRINKRFINIIFI